jgi:hypothetical protein
VGKKPEGRTSLWDVLACWIKTASEELDMLRKSALATTVINCNLMDTIGVKDTEVDRAWFTVTAIHADVVQLNPEPQ